MTSAHAPSIASALAATARSLLAAREGRSEGLVSVPLPLDLLEAIVGTSLDALRRSADASWERPRAGVHLFGIGTAMRLRGGLDEPLTGAIPALRALRRSAIGVDVPAEARPRFFGGARFDPRTPATDPSWESFGGWQFVLPQVLVALVNGGLSATATAFIRDGETETHLVSAIAQALEGEGRRLGSFPDISQPGVEDWRRAVTHAVREIRAGAYQKVVLARRATVEQGDDSDAARTISRLADRYADCFVFGFRAGQATWLGASPELLVSLVGGEVKAVSLAGSRPRGADEATDAALGAELMASEKERSEHAFVVDAIRDTLRPLCADLTVPDEPVLMRLANIQHLYTPLTGLAADGVDVLDFVVRMHPTPAVGGSPREVALEAVRRLEGLDRGWYAAPIGWLDLAGDGEFAVGLRAGLISAERAALYAGAGIVAGSDPDQEVAEVELKLRPLRSALGDG